MVDDQIHNLTETLSVVRGELEDLINALDHLSDIAPASGDLQRKVDTWADMVATLRNGVRAEIRAELDRIL